MLMPALLQPAPDMYKLNEHGFFPHTIKWRFITKMVKYWHELFSHRSELRLVWEKRPAKLITGVLQMGLPNPRNKDLNDLAAALHALQQCTEKTNHPVDALALQYPRQWGGWQASEGRGETSQEKQPVSYEEAKTIVKEKQRRRWLQ